MKGRAKSLFYALDSDLVSAEGKTDGIITFSKAVPHGEAHSSIDQVMMTRISDGKNTFVHASDTQFLSSQAISEILDFKPNIVLAGGPPVYLRRFMREKTELAWNNALRLARGVDTLILDHHLLRCQEGLLWLQRLSNETGHRVICAADFMGLHHHLLEAWSSQLYQEIPVPDGWDKQYALHSTSTERYLNTARKMYKWFCY